MSGPLVVPLGRYLGLLPVDRPAGPQLEHVVRVGGSRVELSDDEHLVWALAHGVPGAPDLDGWDRAALRRHLPSADVDATVGRLTVAGLLVEVAGPVEEFARSVRLLPQAIGLGNDEADSRTFRLGHPGAPLVAVSTEAFFLWSWSGVEPDLWTACVHAAGAARLGGAADPRALLAGLLGNLHVLLSTNVACVDRVLA